MMGMTEWAPGSALTAGRMEASLAAPWIVGIVAMIATLSGGAIALRFHHRLNSLLGLSSGTIIGVALLDLLPEALQLDAGEHSALPLTSAVASGMMSYLLVDWSFSRRDRTGRGHRRHLGPASLALHSTFDGFGIGVAFHVSSEVGMLVAAAVLAHDLLDGANTVALSLTSGSDRGAASKWLTADAFAPLLGLGIAAVTPVAHPHLALLLAFFAGGFLYIGASELLPRSRAQADTLLQVGSVALGLAMIYIVVQVSG